MSDLLINPYQFGAAAFDPLTAITWENVYWAEDPNWTNPGNGNPVDSWRDASGNARNMVAAGALRPTYSSTGLNSRPAVTFNGSNTISCTSHTLPGSYSLVAIFKTDSALVSVDANIFGRTGTSTLYIDGGTDRLSAIYAGASVLADAANTTNPRISIAYIDTSGTSDAIWVDGVNKAGSAGNAGTASVNTVAGSWAGSPSLTGAIAFCAIHNGDIRNDAQFAAFKTWASGLYGMTIV